MLPLPSYDEFTLLFPEFTTVTADRYFAWEPVAELFIDKVKWRKIYNLGIYLYIAHLLTLEKMNSQFASGGIAPAGPAASESKTVGNVSKTTTYSTGVINKDMGQWGKTDYGQRLWQLMRQIGVAPLIS